MQQWPPLHLSGVWVNRFMVPETVMRGGGGVKGVITTRCRGRCRDLGLPVQRVIRVGVSAGDEKRFSQPLKLAATQLGCFGRGGFRAQT